MQVKFRQRLEREFICTTSQIIKISVYSQSQGCPKQQRSKFVKIKYYNYHATRIRSAVQIRMQSTKSQTNLDSFLKR